MTLPSRLLGNSQPQTGEEAGWELISSSPEEADKKRKLRRAGCESRGLR